ncbi:MAG: ATP-binding protein [Bacteroidia bacterium]|nr:ATP-binding protein [Bacteroidia bacterium]
MNNQFIVRDLCTNIDRVFNYFSVVTMIGPRQSGKTTMCRSLYADLPYVNLEDASTLLEVQQDPKAFLTKWKEGMIIDEAQRYPNIFSYLQVLVDEDRIRGNGNRRFVVTGSANFALMERVSQSMAGRTAVVTLLPLSTHEILSRYPQFSTDERILRGGYPALWVNDMAGRDLILGNYYTTYVERDLRQLVQIKDLFQFNTFMRLCAGRIGTECNASALAVAVGVSVPTIQFWLSVLEASYIIYPLRPYHANIKKRLVKTPKLYFYDTGLASWLLGIHSVEQMATHPLRGNLFENMVINEFVKERYNRLQTPNLYYYRDQQQHEVDLLSVADDSTFSAYEIKSGQTYRPEYFDGLRYLRNLFPDTLTSSRIVYDGDQPNPSPTDGLVNYRNIGDLKI